MKMQTVEPNGWTSFWYFFFLFKWSVRDIIQKVITVYPNPTWTHRQTHPWWHGQCKHGKKDKGRTKTVKFGRVTLFRFCGLLPTNFAWFYSFVHAGYQGGCRETAHFAPCLDAISAYTLQLRLWLNRPFVEASFPWSLFLCCGERCLDVNDLMT